MSIMWFSLVVLLWASVGFAVTCLFKAWRCRIEAHKPRVPEEEPEPEPEPEPEHAPRVVAVVERRTHVVSGCCSVPLDGSDVTVVIEDTRHDFRAQGIGLLLALNSALDLPAIVAAVRITCIVSDKVVLDMPAAFILVDHAGQTHTEHGAYYSGMCVLPRPLAILCGREVEVRIGLRSSCEIVPQEYRTACSGSGAVATVYLAGIEMIRSGELP